MLCIAPAPLRLVECECEANECQRQRQKLSQCNHHSSIPRRVPFTSLCGAFLPVEPNNATVALSSPSSAVPRAALLNATRFLPSTLSHRTGSKSSQMSISTPLIAAQTSASWVTLSLFPSNPSQSSAAVPPTSSQAGNPSYTTTLRLRQHLTRGCPSSRPPSGSPSTPPSPASSTHGKSSLVSVTLTLPPL